MTTTWKSDDKNRTNQKPNTQATNNNNNSGATPGPSSENMLSSWSRQQKLAMIACFVLLGVLLIVSACSTESPKPPLGWISGTAATSAATPAIPASSLTASGSLTAATVPAAAPAKKLSKRRPANVTYTDSDSGVSFLYPRKFSVISGDKAQPQLAGLGDVPMNFTESGGSTIATVALPADSYPGTDFSSAFFSVNVNRATSEQACGHFAFVDTRNADGEPVDAEKVKIGAADMETTSSFSASADAQAEAQYYHSYENGACYEYVLGLGTEGFGSEGRVEHEVEHIDRDQVFARLEKILATVKINSVEPKPAVESEATGMNGGKE